MSIINDNLKKADNVINNKDIHNDLYMRIYTFTTENIKGYLKYFNFKNKSVFTVGSSGDQILNAYKEGARDLTLIDINPFSKYYLNLKIAAIYSLSYREFIIFFFKNIGLMKNNKRFNNDLFNKLKFNLKSIDYDSYYFFEKIFSKYSKDIIGDYLLNDDNNVSKIIEKINNYLENENSYNEMKKIIKDIYFNFIMEDIFRFNRNLKFDNILLSNLCTTVNLYSLKTLIEKLNNNLNNYGSMLIGYLWNLEYESNEIDFDWKHAYIMPATRSLLKNYITEHYNISGIYDILFNENKDRDLVLIYRKDKK